MYSLNEYLLSLKSQSLGVDIDLVEKGLSLHDGDGHHLLDLVHGLVENLSVEFLNDLVSQLLVTLVQVLGCESFSGESLVVFIDGVVSERASSLIYLLGVENSELFKVLVQNVLELRHLDNLVQLSVINYAEFDLEVLLDPL